MGSKTDPWVLGSKPRPMGPEPSPMGFEPTWTHGFNIIYIGKIQGSGSQTNPTEEHYLCETSIGIDFFYTQTALTSSIVTSLANLTN